MTRGGTRVFALLGNPVRHSVSPAMHEAAFRALGLDARYLALEVKTDELGPLMRTLVRSGGGGNLTVPHKRAGARFAVGRDGVRLPSCNTFWGSGTEIIGADTDSAGIQSAWKSVGAPGGDWLVLGTGGSALAAARAAAAVGARVRVRSRTPARAEAFGREIAELGSVPADGDGPPGVVINCTPLGLRPDDPHPIPVAEVPLGAAAIDLVYARDGTRWTRALAERGTPAVDGRGVLVGQGAAAFECWFPGLQAPVEVMHAAVAGALR
jgi:shikimate dehydrogenase